MGWLAVHFFAHLQGAKFYRALHEEAVALLPLGMGLTWLDIGCGPGLVAHLAAGRGYQATGIDIDPGMVMMARRIGKRISSSAEFMTGNLSTPLPHGQCVDVVSAASLLFVLGDRSAATRQMLTHLKPNGVMLVVETTPNMRLSEAWRWLRQTGYSRRAWMLLLWAWVRGGRSVTAEDLNVEYWRTESIPLMGGLVAAWKIMAST